MAKASIEVLNALRRTIQRLELTADYQWGHMGACNCGHLAQEITSLKKAEIHRRAMERYGDWNEQLNDYCPTSGLAMDDMISQMLEAGFDIDDLKNLEKLSSREILNQLPAERRNLKHNVKQDVITYMKAWTVLIENQLVDQITLEETEPVESSVVVA